MKTVDYVLAGTLVVGGLAWGLHVFYIDPVDMILKQYAQWAYGLVGLAAGVAVYRLWTKKWT